MVVDDLRYGGAERQVVELANNIDRNRFDIHVCALSDDVPLRDTLIDAEHRLHTIRMMNRLDFTVIPRLARLVRALKADVVHGYLFSAEIASRLAGRLAGTKVIVGSERNANQTFRASNILAYKLTQRCVDIIVANSYAGTESNSKLFNRPRSNYRVVHNGVDAKRFRPMNGTKIRQELGIPLQCPVIGAFANYKKQKNHSMLLRAFRLALQSFPEAMLLIVGNQPFDGRGRYNSYEGRLHRMVDDLGIRRQCMFLTKRTDTERLYPVCNITVLSSLHEGTPNVLLESMACCVPVIATNVCDNEYIVKGGEVGHLVEVGDEVGMAHRMEFLLGNNALREEMGRKARNWVLEEFSTKRLAEKMGSVYMDALDGKHK